MATRRICRPCRTLLNPELRNTLLPASTTSTPFSPVRQSPQRPRRRSIHYLPDLRHYDHFAQDGVRRFIQRPDGSETERVLVSPAAFKMAWRDYQNVLLHNLNNLSQDDASASNQKPLVVARRFARDPARAELFNYASAAHNNEFFWGAFSDNPRPLSDFEHLRYSLSVDFKGDNALKALMLQSAMGMFGGGYVWLVLVSPAIGQSLSLDRYWRVLVTYNAGTPYTMLRGSDDKVGKGRQQGVDHNNLPQGSMSASSFGAHSAAARQDRNRPQGAPEDIHPVLCVSTWMHVYLMDHSISGKEQYLDAWWDNIDWARVNARLPTGWMDSRVDNGQYDPAMDEP